MSTGRHGHGHLPAITDRLEGVADDGAERFLNLGAINRHRQWLR